MVLIESRTIQELPRELLKTRQEFQEAMYRVTDRLKIVEKAQDALGWGPHVILYSLKGKAELIRKVLLEVGESPAVLDDELVYRDWSRYREEFVGEISQCLDREFEASVADRLAGAATCPRWMFEINDFESFRSDRDVVELFLIGYGSENEPLRRYQETIRMHDSAVKDCVLRRVMPEMQRTGMYRHVKDLNIDWLPVQFWWRHL